MKEGLISQLAYRAELFDGTQGSRYKEAMKFAELIVQECVELTLDYKNEQHYNGWLDYRNEIKKHFGIE